jgi:Flp pilus assembly protein TadG
MLAIIMQAVRNYRKSTQGSVTVTFSVLLLPTLLIMGAALDYGRLIKAQAQLQAAVDSATLAGSSVPAASRDTVARAAFASALATFDGSTTASFSTVGSDYTGSVAGQIPTTFMKIAGVDTMSLTVVAKVSTGSQDTSCIWTLGSGMSLAASSMTFNGAPSVNLSGCGLRSNTSITCNGHSTSANYSLALGTVDGCPNPSATKTISDPYAPLAASVSTICGTLSGAVTWSTGSVPTDVNLKTVNRGAYTEYHVCGDLTLTGTGAQAGTSSSADTVLVVENGSITLASDADITSNRTTFVLTGPFRGNEPISFPTGNGHGASWSISPTISASVPLAGIAIFEPSASGIASVNWGPGASLSADGIIYMPAVDITMSGNATSGSNGCTMFVANTFATNGNVGLTLAQSATGCNRVASAMPSSAAYLSQ